MSLFGLLYFCFTVACLFLFRGIPVANIAFGFPLGALIVRRYEKRVYPVVFSDDPFPWLRDLLSMALLSSGFTMLICWLQLVGAMVIVHFGHQGSAAIDWIPLIAPENLPSFRPRLFVMLISPGLQILTTVFGGVFSLLLKHK
jgi:hypothetical protein